MARCHFLYGLRLTTNLPISCLPYFDGPSDADVEIHLNQKSDRESVFSGSSFIPSYVSSSSANNGEPVARFGVLDDSYYGFFYPDGARFAVRRDGREIWANGPEDYALEDLATYLVGPVIGLVLRLFGMLPLHACGVDVDGKAVALLGPQGAGKSTSAAAFAKLGFGILSEDIVAVAENGEGFLAQSGYPRVNLWPESATTIFGSEHGLLPVTPTWGKHFLPLEDARHRFQSGPLEMGAAFILGDRVAGAQRPRIERISPASAMTVLVTNTYVNYLLDAAMRRTEFVQLGRFLRRVPVYQVSPPDDPSRVYELCESIAGEARRSAAHQNVS